MKQSLRCHLAALLRCQAVFVITPLPVQARWLCHPDLLDPPTTLLWLVEAEAAIHLAEAAVRAVISPEAILLQHKPTA
jgi:hypothetical protein